MDPRSQQEYQATYRFEINESRSSSSHRRIDPSLTVQPYVNGNSVSAQQPAQTTYTDTVNDGFMDFQGLQRS